MKLQKLVYSTKMNRYLISWLSMAFICLLRPVGAQILTAEEIAMLLGDDIEISAEMINESNKQTSHYLLNESALRSKQEMVPTLTEDELKYFANMFSEEANSEAWSNPKARIQDINFYELFQLKYTTSNLNIQKRLFHIERRISKMDLKDINPKLFLFRLKQARYVFSSPARQLEYLSELRKVNLITKENFVSSIRRLRKSYLENKKPKNCVSQLAYFKKLFELRI